MLIGSSILWLASTIYAFLAFFYYPCVGVNTGGAYWIIFAIPVLTLWLIINSCFYIPRLLKVNNKKTLAFAVIALLGIFISIMFFFPNFDVWSIGEAVCGFAR